jgi:outer membrane protein assembly factor BamB
VDLRSVAGRSALLWLSAIYCCLAPAPSQAEPPPAQAADEAPAKGQPNAPPAQPKNQIRLNVQVQPGRGFVPGRNLQMNVMSAGEGQESVVFAKDRESEQLLKKAQRFLEEKRYSEAVRSLGTLIGAPEDFFYQADSEAALHRSLKAEAQSMLARMPREAREVYELQYGAEAEQLLKDALERRDWQALADVSRRFFHTQAGRTATYLLGAYHFDHDRPLAAALCFRRLADSGDTSALEPGLSLQAAAAWARAGMEDAARETLLRAKQKYAGAKVAIGGEEIEWFDADDQALAWLNRQIGGDGRIASTAKDQWTMYRGDPARNAKTHGGSPLLDHEGNTWWIPVAEEPGVEKLVRQLRHTYLDANFTALPALHPLVVNDVVLMRTVTTLLAVDFKSGKRLWNVPVDDEWEEVTDLQGAIAQQGNAAQVVSLVDQRLWDDLTYGCLSSDGEYVFSVEDLNFHLPGAAHMKMVVLPNGRRVPAPAWPRSFNRLAAHDIRTGKLKWELGGPRGEYELEMAGAFFLGPPLPLQDNVYALAELNGEIRLAAIDARTGKVEWAQQLAVVELDVLQDPARRFSGVSPSYADGVLICPTGSGAVVAIDLTTRTLLWGHLYPNQLASQPNGIGRRIGAVMMFAGRPRDEADRWMDSAATIAGGRVIVTPLESGEIHCLNLLDGTLAWKQPRGENLYVAGVHDARVLLVGRSGMQALRLEDGQPAWAEPLRLPGGASPSGRGFLSGDRYYLPVTSAEVFTIDVTTGKLIERSRSRKGEAPGNLVAHQGMILSQSAEALEVFFELETLQQQVAAALEKNPADAEALAQRGALALHHGDTAAAVVDLRKAHQIAQTPRIRNLLVDALFDAIGEDFEKYADAGPELQSLVSTPEEKSRYLRLMAEGMQKKGNARAAFDLYAQLADQPVAEGLEKVSDTLRARRDRWAQAGLASMYASLAGADRVAVDQLITNRVAVALATRNADELKRVSRYFGFHPSTERARAELADRLGTAGDWLAAELAWREVAAGGDAVLSRQAAVRLAQLMLQAGRPESAASYARRLSGELADAVCLEGKTGRQWRETLSQDERLQHVDQDIWPRGRIIKERDDRQAATARYFQAELLGGSDIYPQEMTIEMSQDRQTLVGRDGHGRERWKASLAESMMRQNLNPSVLQARAVGNLVMVSLGQQILAIDTLATGPAGMARVLWTQDLSEGLPGIANNVGVHVRQIELQWGQRRNLVSDGFGRPVAVLGELTASYFCFQRARELVVVDPLSGDTLWTRGDVEPASEVFGDDELLFIVPPNAMEAVVLSAIDGHELGRRPVMPVNQRVLAQGRRLISWQLSQGKHVFEMTDLWEQKPIWRREFSFHAKAYQLDQELLGIVDPKGQFTLISLVDGKSLVDCEIEAEPRLSEIYLLGSRERVLLFTNRAWAHGQDGISVQAVPGVLNNPLLNGMAYAFDRKTGQKLWQAPIDKQGLTLDQPRELPVLVFASRVYERQAAQGNVNTQPYTSVMCLDKRTGKVAYQEKMAGHIGIFEIDSRPEERIVELKLLRHSVRMKFTDEPIPPEEEAAADAAEKPAEPADTPPPQEAGEEAAAEPAEAKPAEVKPEPSPEDQGRLWPRRGAIRVDSLGWIESLAVERIA